MYRTVPYRTVLIASFMTFAFAITSPVVRAQSTNSGGAELLVTVTVEPKRVMGLRWSTANVRQEATLTVSAEAEGAPGTFVMTYEWSSDGLLFDDPTAQTTTARAITPGKFTVNCGVTARNPAGGGIVFEGADWETVAAIGGPLQLGVTGAEPGTQPPALQVNVDATAQLQFGPWHVQYFGYDRSQGVPAKYQRSQMDTVTAYSGQPIGTTYAWTLPAPLKLYQSVPPTEPSIVVCATAGSGGAQLKPALTYHYTDPTDESLTGSTEDDSDETPPQGASVASPQFYRFVVHKPIDLTDELRSHQVFPQEGYDAIGVRDSYVCTLLSDAGLPMPGVWVVERVTNVVGNPPLTIDVPWVTMPTGSWNVNLGGEPPLTVTMKGGQFADFIAAIPNYVQVPPAPPITQCIQKYYAGTNDLLPSSTTGLYVARYEIKVWSDRTAHTKLPL